MSRRRSVRRARRVQVTFWKRGDPHGYPGYTTNVSLTGMFIGTNSPFPDGTRVRVEIHGERGFVIEGIVAHARKVRSDLGRISPSGMGVRFLSAEDLVRELLPSIGAELEEIPGEPPAAPAPPPPPTAAPPQPQGGAAYSLSFASPRQFLEVFERDIRHGGLFVSTPEPGRLQEVVTIDLHPPEAGAPPIRVRARVVQRFEPRAGGGGDRTPLAGMGVELLDSKTVCERLQPFIQRLRE